MKNFNVIERDKITKLTVAFDQSNVQLFSKLNTEIRFLLSNRFDVSCRTNSLEYNRPEETDDS